MLMMILILMMPMIMMVRGAKSGGTGEPGSQRVYWPAESFWIPEEKLSLYSCLQKNSETLNWFYVSADNDFNIKCKFVANNILQNFISAN
jgi:hypothetical protein